MFAALKSEIRKVLTVRSTYVIIGIGLFIVTFLGFYANGLRATPATILDTNLMKSLIQQAVLVTSLLGSLVGVLLVTHEYRYNTIVYTLTSTNNRTKVFLAKFLAISIFSACFTLMVAILTPLLTQLGLSVKGLSLIPQHMQIVPLFWQVIFVGWAYSGMAFIFAMLLRVQVGSISLMFLVPGMVEPLLSLILKKQAVYLPFNALQAVLEQHNDLPAISILKGVGIASVYLVVGLVISWQLFLRRDAQ